MEKKYLICIDSDGCAMDTMNSKHIKCFGPYMVKEWGLETWETSVLNRWNEVNLYTMTRGINRFQGLYRALRGRGEIHARGRPGGPGPVGGEHAGIVERFSGT